MQNSDRKAQFLNIRANFYLIKLAWKWIKGKNTQELFKLFGMSASKYSGLVNAGTNPESRSYSFFLGLPDKMRASMGKRNALDVLKISNAIVRGEKLLDIGSAFYGSRNPTEYWTDFFVGRKESPIYGNRKAETPEEKKIENCLIEIKGSTATTRKEMKEIIRAIEQYQPEVTKDKFETVYDLLTETKKPDFDNRFKNGISRKEEREFWRAYSALLDKHLKDLQAYIRVFVVEDKK